MSITGKVLAFKWLNWLALGYTGCQSSGGHWSKLTLFSPFLGLGSLTQLQPNWALPVCTLGEQGLHLCQASSRQGFASCPHPWEFCLLEITGISSSVLS